MPRTKVQPEPEQEVQQETQGYNLEPMNDDLRSRLNVWGNATQLTIQQLEKIAPEWAKFMNDIFVTVGGLMETFE
jgi:hypothetical protein